MRVENQVVRGLDDSSVITNALVLRPWATTVTMVATPELPGLPGLCRPTVIPLARMTRPCLSVCVAALAVVVPWSVLPTIVGHTMPPLF